MTDIEKKSIFIKFNAKTFNRLNKNNKKLDNDKKDDICKILVNLRWQAVNYLNNLAPELSSQSQDMFFALSEKYGVILTEPKAENKK